MSEPPATTALDDFVRRLERLFPAVVSDMLDAVGFRSQVLEPRVRPLFPTARVVGKAATVKAIPVEDVPESSSDHYKLHLEAIEALGPNDIMVTSKIEVCFWGELLSIAARQRGATGIVVDGYTRDVEGIERLGFPVFCTGISAADALGRSDVIEYGETVVSGGVTVNAGDLVIGDKDGVVVVPLDAAEEVLTRAEEKVEGENLVRQKLTEGMPVTEAFERYGIL